MNPTPDAGNSSDDDPFGTAELRAAVLDTWLRSPARLREDANAEESLSLVGYAGRVLVELAANAADAATEAGVPGRLRITVADDELRIANTGKPLTAAGVASLASLRASSKRHSDGIGHFGVGFTAVLAVSDRPSVVSTSGGVCFSPSATAHAVVALGSAALDAEVSARDGHVPVLRLPWPCDGTPPAGFATEVRLPLRPGVDAADVLASVGDHLLLALPGVDVIETPDRVLTREVAQPGTVVLTENGVPRTWQVSTRTGRLDEAVLVGLPTEQRRRRDWRLSWAYPRDSALGPDVLYSPTPTDESLSLPARLIGTFPVDDTRRHLAAGAITELLLDEAVHGYLDLMADVPAEERLRLLPATDFGRSEVDNRLRQGIWVAARRTPLLVGIAGEAVRPADATMLPGASSELVALAAEAVPGLLPTPRDTTERDALRALGVRSIGYPELSTALGALSRGADFWGRVYAQLDGAAVDDLADLPVPLAGGRTVLGARGCLVAEDVTSGWLADLAAEVPGLRVVHPDAVSASSARRLLLRIGAQPADPTAILADPGVLAAATILREDLEQDDLPTERFEAFAGAVLEVIAAGAEPTQELRDQLLLTTADGEPWPAAELLLPDAPLAAVLADDADFEQLDPQWLVRFEATVLARAGVLVGFRVVTDDEPHGPDHDLPDEESYWDEVLGDRPPPASFAAIADLDLVDDDRWPAALELIRGDRQTRETLRSGGDVPTYTAWWLSRFARLAGRPPTWWRTAEAAELAGLYDVLPTPLPPDVAAAIGVRSSLAAVLADDPEDLLRRFTDARRTVPAFRVADLTAALVEAMGHRSPAALPAGVRTMAGTVIDADDAVVLDMFWLTQVLEPGTVVPGGADPAAVARFFDLEPASERFRWTPAVGSAGDAEPAVPTDVVRRLAAELGVAAVGGVTVTPGLAAVAPDGIRRPVRWWVVGDAGWVDGSAIGWGRWLAYRAGNWSLRHTATALLAGDGVGVVEDGLAAGTHSAPPGS